MNIKETVRYATLGAAAALLVSGGIYAGSAFQAQQLSARASGGYSGNFDYVQKQGNGNNSAALAASDDSAEPAPSGAQQDPGAGAAENAPADPATEPPATSDATPGPTPAVDPTLAPAAEPAGDDPAPAEDPEPAVAEDPAPATDAASEEPADEPGTEPEPGEDPKEPGGGVTLGPAIFKAIDPCLLVKCDPVPPPDTLALDPCLINDCVEVEGGPVVVPPLFVPGVPPPVFQFR